MMKNAFNDCCDRKKFLEQNSRMHIFFYDLENYYVKLSLTRSFLAPLAVGQRAYVMVRCPSCMHASVRALTFSLNIFFSETTYRILMKFYRNVPAMVLFRFF